MNKLIGQLLGDQFISLECETASCVGRGITVPQSYFDCFGCCRCVCGRGVKVWR